jgi:DNA-directed RNA polymerase subunit F
MTFKEVLEEEPLTIPEAKAILEKAVEERKKVNEELAYETRRAIEHVNLFAKLSEEKAEALLKELIDHGIKKKEIAIKIVDLMPMTIDELRAIYAKERFSLTTEELEEILDVVRNHII